MPRKHRKSVRCRKCKRKRRIIIIKIIKKTRRRKHNRYPNPCIPPNPCPPYILPIPCPCNNEVEVTVMRFFLIPNSDIQLTGPINIPANQFADDNGNNIINFPESGGNSITNLYINGILQPSGLYRVSTNGLTINSTGDTIYSGTPIILEIIQLSTKPIQ